MKKESRLSTAEILSVLWPYLLVVCTLLALFVVGLQISSRIISRNAASMISEQFQTISDNVYLNITRSERICELLATDSTISDLSNPEGDSPEEIESKIGLLRRQLENIGYVSSVDYLDLMVLFPNLETVVTAQQVGTGTEEVEQMTAAATENRVSFSALRENPVYSSRNLYYSENRCIMLRSIYERNRIIAYVILSLPLDQLVPMGNLDGLILIGGETGYVYTNDSGVDQREYLDIRRQVLENRTFERDGQEYMATICVFSQLQQNDIMVGVPLLPSAVGMESFQRTAIWLGVACVCSLAVLFLILYRRVLLPMKYLAEVTVQGDERHLIKKARNSIVALRNQNEAGQKEIRFLIPLGIGELIQRICSAQPEDNRLATARRCMSLAGIQEQRRFFLFGLFHLEDQEDTFREMAWQNADVTPIFVLNNLLGDLLFARGVVGSIAVVGRYYIVLGSCSESQDEGYFNGILHQLTEFYQKYYAVTLAATHPLFGEGAQEFERQVQRTMENLSYLDFWDKDQVQQEEDLPNNVLLPYLKSMRNLINRLDERDYTGAEETFRKLMSDLPAGPQMLKIAKYRVYGLIEVLLAALVDQPGISDSEIARLDYGNRLYQVNNIQDFRAETEKIFAEIIRISHDSAPEISGSKRMEQVQQYVTEHYTENSLTVSSIAEQFGISVAYLSREYKKCMKINLIDQIQRLRIERAKELMKTETVKRAAALSGFGDPQALVRTFKKLEGMTPNEFRQMLAREQQESAGADG
ncbi:MAG TPA: AraC family transcriptional regulator [Candidatus Pygmaiobacter gallistercoris]|nr:AraC family transcriptional regulator [Candidatus Pygmaiobacter gallistercoris]